jgi:hypothetical protein
VTARLALATERDGVWVGWCEVAAGVFGGLEAEWLTHQQTRWCRAWVREVFPRGDEELRDGLVCTELINAAVQSGAEYGDG